MSDAFVVEIWGEQVGLAIRERGGFRFFAAAPGIGGILLLSLLMFLLCYE